MGPDLTGWYSLDGYVTPPPYPLPPPPPPYLEWTAGDSAGVQDVLLCGGRDGSNCNLGPAKFSDPIANGWKGTWPGAVWHPGGHPPEGACDITYSIDTALLIGEHLTIDHAAAAGSVGTNAMETCTPALAVQYLAGGNLPVVAEITATHL